MKITLNQDPAFEDTEVIINCPRVDEDILRMAAMLRVANQKMTGTLDGGHPHRRCQGHLIHRHRGQKDLYLHSRRRL